MKPLSMCVCGGCWLLYTYVLFAQQPSRSVQIAMAPTQGPPYSGHSLSQWDRSCLIEMIKREGRDKIK